ncbi:MAG: aromatic amino acid transport family protein [Patescibacteria group bacterium]
MKNYFLAIATLTGTIIGVGIFTLPFVFNQAGIIFLLLYMGVLGFIQCYLHLLFAEVVLSSNDYHRLPGYVAKYAGKKSKCLTLLITMSSDYGAVIAYIIVGGLFLHQLLNPLFGGSILLWTTILFSIEALIVFCGLKLIAEAEFVATFLIITVVGIIAWKGWGYFSLANYNMIEWSNSFLPYGPVFFAVGGGVAIPAVCKLLDKNKEKIKSAIFWGTFIPVAVMSIFVLIIIGITGNKITPDTLIGLSSIFKNGVMFSALVFGLLAIFTSFLTIAQALKETFLLDFKINKTIAWALACLIPYLLYLAGLRDLIKIISLTGALGGGICGIILLWLISQVKKKSDKKSIINNKINKLIIYFLSLLFILGFIYEIKELIN